MSFNILLGFGEGEPPYNSKDSFDFEVRRAYHYTENQGNIYVYAVKFCPVGDNSIVSQILLYLVVLSRQLSILLYACKCQRALDFCLKDKNKTLAQPL